MADIVNQQLKIQVEKVTHNTTEIRYYAPDDSLLVTVPGQDVSCKEAQKMIDEAVDKYNKSKTNKS